MYHALLEPGDRILGMKLDHGGHLSHGMKINFSGRLYDIVAYGVREEDSRIDMDELAQIAEDAKPKLILAGWSAYPRQLDFARFREIADSVGAYLVVDMAHFAGLVAAEQHPSPVPFADVVSTTVHKTIGGARGGMILCREEFAKKIDSAVFPGQQGGPLMHVVAGKAVALRIAATELFRERQRRTRDGSGARGRGDGRRRRERAHGRHRRSPGAGRPARLGARRPAGRGPPGFRGDHRQPQRGAVRSAPAVRVLGPPDRHARRWPRAGSRPTTSVRSAR